MSSSHPLLLRTVVALPVAWALGGCTAFATVRSAEVRPGPSAIAQVSSTGRVGDVTGWFWSFDCAQGCGRAIPSLETGFAYGWRRAAAGGPRGGAVGVGMSGIYPYLDGYAQLGGGRRPFGVGGRVGVPFTSWREHQLYGRVDLPVGGEGVRLLLNPALFVHEGRAPNGMNPGTFLGFVQGAGMLIPGERTSTTLALALVAGRARRVSYGPGPDSERALFATGSFSITWHRRRGVP